MQKLVFYCCLSLLSYQSAAQSFAVRNYSIAEGLPSSEVYDVFQDSKGFIWFGTDNGAVQFDGHEMTVFRVAEGLEDPVVFGIQEDHRGRIWFRTYSNNFFCYEDGKIVPYPHNDSVAKVLFNQKGTIIPSFFIDSKDNFWFAGPGIFVHISSRGELFRDSLPRSHMFYKTIESGNIYINGIGIETAISIDGKIFPFVVAQRKQYPLTFISARSENSIYINVDNSIFEYNGKALRKVLSGNGRIISLYLDPSGYLWVGYLNKGVERYNINDFKNPVTLDFLKQKSVTKVLRDNEGGLWLTTLENGVFYEPNLSIELYSFTNPSKIKAVITAENQIVYGTYDGSLTFFEEASKKQSVKKKFDRELITLFYDSRRSFWVTAGDFFFLSKNFKEYKTNFPAARPTIVDLAEDSKGNIWALATYSLWKLDQNGKILSEKRRASSGRSMLFEDSILYVSERLGLQVYDTSMNLIHTPISLAKLKISKLLRVNDTTLFIATIGSGFLLVNNKKWTHRQFNSQNQFIADNIYAAAKTDSTLWLGTDQGLFISDIHSLLAGNLSFTHITKNSGLIADKVNFVVLTKKDAWAFSDEGISIVPYTASHTESRIPTFYLKKLIVNKKEINIHTLGDQNLKLDYDATDISLALGYLSVRDQNIISRYRLTKDEPWIYTRDRRLQFSSLAPAEYLLELEYSTDNFHWTKASSSIKFIVTPPWWQRWYVLAGGFLVLAFFVYLYFRNYYRTLHKHQQKLIQAEFESMERERNRIAKELHDGVATNLSAIKLMVNHLLNSHKEPMAEELDEHFLYTIKEIKGIIYGLTPPGLERDGLFTGLKNYVEKLNKTIPVKIHLDAAGEEIHKPDLGILAFRVIQELLSNAVRHSSAKNISIRLRSENSQLNILFQDDGIGFLYDPEKKGWDLPT